MKEDRISVRSALVHGDLYTKLSVVLMGAGLLFHGQIIKGVLVLLFEAAFWFYMIRAGFFNLSMLPSLGTQEQGKVWNEAKQIYEYTAGDNSQQILLAGVITCFVIAAIITLWILQLRQSYSLQKQIGRGEKVNGLRDDIRSLFDGNRHITLMTLPCIGILIFNIVPLVYMISMAFTTYSKEDNHLILFDWVGLRNFATLFDRSSVLGGTFWRVLIWTLVWAFFATFTNYFFGMILAILINRKDTKIKGFWRFCFVLSCAVPRFVSLLIMRTMLSFPKLDASSSGRGGLM